MAHPLSQVAESLFRPDGVERIVPTADSGHFGWNCDSCLAPCLSLAYIKGVMHGQIDGAGHPVVSSVEAALKENHMQLTITIPDDIARRLAPAGNPERAAVEHLALAGYVSGTLGFYQVQQLLGFDNRWDTEEWLGSRGATMQYTLADLDLDRANLDRVLGR